jgi:hypothetical protein
MMLAVLGGLALTTPAQAQRTQDEARLVFTMGLTHTSGSDLWSVRGQPILIPNGVGFDQVDLTRNIRGSVGVLFSGMYYPKPALGLVAETFFMGVGLGDRCQVTSAAPDARTVQLCGSIDGARKSSSAVLVSAGPVLRMGGNQPISPYVRAEAGLLFSNLSPIRTLGTVTAGNGSFVDVVYDDPSSTRVTPGFVFGGGVTTVIGKGWQLRTEVRNNLVKIATVAGPTAPGNDAPQVVNRWKNLFSVVIGADVVLEKKRGRRY